MEFFQAVKTRKPVVEDAVFGHHAALACHMANQSYFRKERRDLGRGFEDHQKLEAVVSRRRRRKRSTSD